MMAKRQVLRVVPLLFPCCAGTRRGQAPCWNHEKGVGVCDSDPSFQTFETESGSG